MLIEYYVVVTFQAVDFYRKRFYLSVIQRKNRSIIRMLYPRSKITVLQLFGAPNLMNLMMMNMPPFGGNFFHYRNTL